MPVIDLSAYKPVPATLGDANQIANGMQAIQNTINGIDNLNFAAGKIFDPAKLMQNAAVDADGLVWDNTNSKWVPSSSATRLRPPGYEFGVGTIVANVNITTFSNSGLANTIVTAPAITFDGLTPVWIEVFILGIQPAAAAGAIIRLWLFDNSGVILGLGFVESQAASSMSEPTVVRVKVTPSAATHAYSVRGDLAGVNSTGIISSGDQFGLGAATPSYIRVVRA